MIVRVLVEPWVGDFEWTPNTAGGSFDVFQSQITNLKPETLNLKPEIFHQVSASLYVVDDSLF